MADSGIRIDNIALATFQLAQKVDVPVTFTFNGKEYKVRLVTEEIDYHAD